MSSTPAYSVSSVATAPSTPAMASTHTAQADVVSRLPTYEEATKTDDISRLPSYRVTRPQRYHPYRLKTPVLADGVGLDRLFNTIYDEEAIRIYAPPAPARRLPTQPLVPTDLLANLNDTGVQYLNYPADVAQLDAEEFERRAQNVAAVILQEFVAGLIRAREA